MSDYSLESYRVRINKCRQLMDNLAMCGWTIPMLAISGSPVCGLSMHRLYLPFIKLIQKTQDLVSSADAGVKQKIERICVDFSLAISETEPSDPERRSPSSPLSPKRIFDTLVLLERVLSSAKTRLSVVRVFTASLNQNSQIFGVTEKITYKEFEDKASWLSTTLEEFTVRHLNLRKYVKVLIDFNARNQRPVLFRTSCLRLGASLDLTHTLISVDLRQRCSVMQIDLDKIHGYLTRSFHAALYWYDDWRAVLISMKDQPHIRPIFDKPENKRLFDLFKKDFVISVQALKVKLDDSDRILNQDTSITRLFARHADFLAVLDRVLVLEKEIRDFQNDIHADYLFLSCYQYSSDYLYPVVSARYVAKPHRGFLGESYVSPSELPPPPVVCQTNSEEANALLLKLSDLISPESVARRASGRVHVDEASARMSVANKEFEERSRIASLTAASFQQIQQSRAAVATFVRAENRGREKMIGEEEGVRSELFASHRCVVAPKKRVSFSHTASFRDSETELLSTPPSTPSPVQSVTVGAFANVAQPPPAAHTRPRARSMFDVAHDGAPTFAWLVPKATDWVRDDDPRASVCAGRRCDVHFKGRSFTLTSGKHHCRLCGHVFCDKCCRNRAIMVPAGHRVAYFSYSKMTGYQEVVHTAPSDVPRPLEFMSCNACFSTREAHFDSVLGRERSASAAAHMHHGEAAAAAPPPPVEVLPPLPSVDEAPPAASYWSYYSPYSFFSRRH